MVGGGPNLVVSGKLVGPVSGARKLPVVGALGGAGGGAIGDDGGPPASVALRSDGRAGGGGGCGGVAGISRFDRSACTVAFGSNGFGCSKSGTSLPPSCVQNFCMSS